MLDESPYWIKFPYDFDEGPQDPDLPIGYHPGPEREGIEGEAKGDGDDDSAAVTGGGDEGDDV